MDPLGAQRIHIRMRGSRKDQGSYNQISHLYIISQCNLHSHAQRKRKQERTWTKYARQDLKNLGEHCEVASFFVRKFLLTLSPNYFH
uniref:Uncharacterized protein n=1 Tax=Anguilla anguilla TaxID=7936 RepID=A0A0E9XMP1_ANGAN